MGRGHGLDHTEKCRKFRQQIENLKMDYEELEEKHTELQEKYDILEARMERERQKNKDLKGY